MIGHCMYRGPVSYAEGPGSVFDRSPDAWLCACPGGDHLLGINCIDDAAKCNIAKAYEKTGLPSFYYKKKAKRLAEKQREQVAAVAEGLPPELAEIVRKKYESPNEAAKRKAR